MLSLLLGVDDEHVNQELSIRRLQDTAFPLEGKTNAPHLAKLRRDQMKPRCQKEKPKGKLSISNKLA